jgi:hypothetical protein
MHRTFIVMVSSFVAMGFVAAGAAQDKLEGTPPAGYLWNNNAERLAPQGYEIPTWRIRPARQLSASPSPFGSRPCR